jgi:hypothetical protein
VYNLIEEMACGFHVLLFVVMRLQFGEFSLKKDERFGGCFSNLKAMLYKT